MIGLQAETIPGEMKWNGRIKAAGARFIATVGRIASLISFQRTQRRLHLCEMLSLGDKRFVAVIEYESRRFLLAGTPQNISLLHHVDGDSEARITSLDPVPHGE